MPARKPKTDERPQSERFIETAREIGADRPSKAFEALVKKMMPERKAKEAERQSPKKN